jgi:predicted dehydrogenase
MNLEQSPLRVGLIGAGVMGSAHARVISQSSRTELAFVVDPHAERGARLADHSGADAHTDLDSLSGCDALVVASPTEHHAEWALRALDAEIPVLVEKPLSDHITESRKLVETARTKDVPLLCGLPERYNPAFVTLRQIVDEPIFLSAQRTSPYNERIPTGVGSDLMIHDLDLTLILLGREPQALQAHFAYCHPNSDAESEDVVQTVLTFSNGVFASLCASRVGQRKVREFTITELDRVIEVDLLRSDITVYRHVANDAIEDGPGYRQQTIIEIPFVPPMDEPLVTQLNRFVDVATGELEADSELATVLAPHELIAQAQASAGTARVPVASTDRP